MTFPERVFEIVRAVPPGLVVTYGQVAALAGFPRRARHVGQALSGCPSSVPWQRVVGAGGTIRVSKPQGQLELLRSEGVEFRGHRVNLGKYQWQPGPLAFAAL